MSGESAPAEQGEERPGSWTDAERIYQIVDDIRAQASEIDWEINSRQAMERIEAYVQERLAARPQPKESATDARELADIIEAGINEAYEAAPRHAYMFPEGYSWQRFYAKKIAAYLASARASSGEAGLRELAEDIVEWAKAYPERIFSEPSPEQVDEICKTLGCRIDNISAMILRAFVKPWEEKARAALGQSEATP